MKKQLIEIVVIVFLLMIDLYVGKWEKIQTKRINKLIKLWKKSISAKSIEKRNGHLKLK